MTYSPLTKVQVTPGGPGSDSFGLLRVSSEKFLFSSYQQYNTSPLFWHYVSTSGGTATHVPAESSTTLAVTTTSGSEMIRQTKQVIPYQPGRSQKLAWTWVGATPQTNQLVQVGLGELATNGVFFETLGLTARFFIRTNTTGSVVETDDQATAVLAANGKVTSSNWNLDALDGSGSAANPSGKQLDTTNGQIMVYDLQWLGLGTVRMGFVIDGVLIYAHSFHHSNLTKKVYMATANLPGHFRIKANGTLAGAASIKTVCFAAASESGDSIFEAQGVPFSESVTDPASAITGVAMHGATETAIFALRLKTVLNNTGQTIFSGAPAGGIVNRALVLPTAVNFESLARSMVVRIYYVPADSGSTFVGGTWTSANDHSVCQYNKGITSFSLAAASTGVIKVAEKFVSSGNSIESLGEILSALRLSLNYAGSASDVLFMTCQRLEANNTIVWGGFDWKELYS